MRDVFLAFLRLGVTSFGGPLAHIGYFRREFVERRGWLDAAGFSAIVAWCSVLPGPTSSQVGLLIGLRRAGIGGAAAAWVAFTLPSAFLMTIFGIILRSLAANGSIAAAPWFGGLLSGLAAAATAVVAQAVLALTRALCVDALTRTIGIGAAAVAIAVSADGRFGWLPIALGALAGLLFAPRAETAEEPEMLRIPRGASLAGAVALAAVVAIVLTPDRLLAPAAALLATMVRAGSLVFGGGHIVLPLLQELTARGLIGDATFYAGYGLAQAMPGPLFTFAAFAGASNASPLSGVAGAAAALLAIYLPTFAMIPALAPVWNRLRTLPRAAAALRGANASVAGLLGAILYHPLLTSLAASSAGVVIALAAFGCIEIWKTPPWIVVVAAAVIGAAAGSTGLIHEMH